MSQNGTASAVSFPATAPRVDASFQIRRRSRALFPRTGRRRVAAEGDIVRSRWRDRGAARQDLFVRRPAAANSSRREPRSGNCRRKRPRCCWCSICWRMPRTRICRPATPPNGAPALEAFAKAQFKSNLRRFACRRPRPAIATAKRWLARSGGGSDGVIAKRLDLPYQAGNRDGMQKIKNFAAPIA